MFCPCLFCPCKQDSMPSVLPSVLPLCVLRPLPCHHIRQRSGGAIVCEKQKHYKELYSIISTLREGLQIISRNLPGAHSAESFGGSRSCRPLDDPLRSGANDDRRANTRVPTARNAARFHLRRSTGAHAADGPTNRGASAASTAAACPHNQSR